jgi:hypothetical protein
MSAERTMPANLPHSSCLTLSSIRPAVATTRHQRAACGTYDYNRCSHSRCSGNTTPSTRSLHMRVSRACAPRQRASVPSDGSVVAPGSSDSHLNTLPQSVLPFRFYGEVASNNVSCPQGSFMHAVTMTHASVTTAGQRAPCGCCSLPYLPTPADRVNALSHITNFLLSLTFLDGIPTRCSNHV